LHPYGQVPLQNPLQGSGEDDEGGLTGAVVTFADLVGAFVTGGGTTGAAVDGFGTGADVAGAGALVVGVGALGLTSLA
jgi:hypothetical protein